MTFGSLFAGIGGMDLGLERAGMVCRWQVEINDYCRQVLDKHWPTVPKYADVRDFPPADVERVDLIAGGFPCQDISLAGTGEGLEGARSGLFFELMRIVRELRPCVLLLENVPALLVRGLGRVLGELAESGFDAEWTCLPAAGLGAPHVRDRLFLVAHADGVLGGPRVRLFAADDWDGPVSQDEYRKRARALGWDLASAPRDCRVDDGLSHGVERHRGLGNAVVPAVAEWIGRRILEARS